MIGRACTPVTLAALAAALLPPVAAAQTRHWPSAPYQGIAPNNPPCTCRAPTGDVEVGHEICLATPTGGRRARCVMVLNNTSWDMKDEGCTAVSMLAR